MCVCVRNECGQKKSLLRRRRTEKERATAHPPTPRRKIIAITPGVSVLTSLTITAEKIILRVAIILKAAEMLCENGGPCQTSIVWGQNLEARCGYDTKADSKQNLWQGRPKRRDHGNQTQSIHQPVVCVFPFDSVSHEHGESTLNQLNTPSD